MVLGMRKHWYPQRTLEDKREHLLSLPTKARDHCATLWNNIWAYHAQVPIEISFLLRWTLLGIRNEEAHYVPGSDELYLRVLSWSHLGWWKCQESLWPNEEKAGFWDWVLCVLTVCHLETKPSLNLSLLICKMGMTTCLGRFPRWTGTWWEQEEQMESLVNTNVT